VMLQQKYL